MDESGGLGQILLGAALLMAASAISVAAALVHAGHAFRAVPTERVARRVGWLWSAVAGGYCVAAVLMGTNVDRLLAPLLPVAILAPALLAAASFAARRPPASRAGRVVLSWANRVLPLSWLGFLIWVVVAVFPRT